jgi:hypothetical protein
VRKGEAVCFLSGTILEITVISALRGDAEIFSRKDETTEAQQLESLLCFHQQSGLLWVLFLALLGTSSVKNLQTSDDRTLFTRFLMTSVSAQEERQSLIRSLFDEYIEMYASRDDRLTARFSENFSGYAGSSDVLVKDKDEWVKITRQDFAQVPGRIRIEMLDILLQDISDDVVAVTAFFHIHLPFPEHILSGETARLVLVFRLKGGDWEIVHSGISIPFGLAQSGEIYPMIRLQEHAYELEVLVEQRTQALKAVNEKLVALRDPRII